MFSPTASKEDEPVLDNVTPTLAAPYGKHLGIAQRINRSTYDTQGAVTPHQGMPLPRESAGSEPIIACARQKSHCAATVAEVGNQRSVSGSDGQAGDRRSGIEAGDRSSGTEAGNQRFGTEAGNQRSVTGNDLDDGSAIISLMIQEVAMLK